MTPHPRFVLAGGALVGASMALGTFVVAAQFAPPIVAAAPALFIAGIWLVAMGMDTENTADDGPPTADDLEDQP